MDKQPTPQPMTVTEARMTMIFNEWARRYAENPEEFDKIIGEDGKPVADYGESCMRYFCKIADEMDNSGLLPTPENPGSFRLTRGTEC